MFPVDAQVSAGFVRYEVLTKPTVRPQGFGLAQTKVCVINI
ncbi:conserved protein of unknown function [Caballeronia sp. S22]